VWASMTIGLVAMRAMAGVDKYSNTDDKLGIDCLI
jgi:hypothetical protein